MKIKHYSPAWPPRNGRARTGQGDIAAVVDLEDVVLTAQKFFLSRDHVGLRLRKNDGLEYGIELILPENVVDRAVAEIATNDLTLRQVGDLEIP
jgi:hypothetical protein